MIVQPKLTHFLSLSLSIIIYMFYDIDYYYHSHHHMSYMEFDPLELKIDM